MHFARGLLLWGMFVAAAAAADSRPNVLLILADDLGFSDLGCYGGEIPTPHIDRLAAGGARFASCYNSARCCPSRASLLTGLHPHQAGIGSFATNQPEAGKGPAYLGHLADNCATLAELLGDAGYFTAMAGKWHMSQPGPTERGFDEFYGYVDGYAKDQWHANGYRRLPQGRDFEITYDDDFYATDAFTDYGLEFLKQARAKHQPWFLYVAHSSPHFPLQAPRATVAKYIDTYRKGWDVLRQDRARRQRELGLWQEGWQLSERSVVPVEPQDIANGYAGVANPAWDDLPEDRREDLARRMAIYAAMVEHVDQGVGRLIDDLTAHRELENTIVIFLSDNGACYEWGPFGFDGNSRAGKTTLHTGAALAEMGQSGTHHSYGSAWANLCNTPLRMYKHFCHEGGISTPLIVHWPAHVKPLGEWVRDPTHLIDVVPTVLEATQTTYPQEFDNHPLQPLEGLSLIPRLAGQPLPPRGLAIEHQGARGYREGDWKIVWSKRQKEPVAWELYNLAADRCETNNLAATMPDKVADLSAKWLAWAQRVKVFPFFQEEQQPLDAQLLHPVPRIAGRGLRISCHVRAESTAGVILAHGGRQRGYALHLDDGHLVFSVRSLEGAYQARSKTTLPRECNIEAELAVSGVMTLRVDGRVVARGLAKGLLDAEPIDELTIGDDPQSQVVHYPPGVFAGEVTNVEVQVLPTSDEIARLSDLPAPLFADPNYNGSCDPEIVWNEHTQQWWIFYTARRATHAKGTYVGTPIGVAASRDLRRWEFVGYCGFDGQPGEPDMPVTYWAPGVIHAGDAYHMFVTYKPSAKPPWGGTGEVRHYICKSDDLLNGWRLGPPVNLTQPDPIDVSVIARQGKYCAYYRVAGTPSQIHWATSDDLNVWHNQGPCAGDVNRRDVHHLEYQEAPYVFESANSYWMLTDPHEGLAVYRSPDAEQWTYQGVVLDEPGIRRRDATRARHPSVAQIQGRTYLLYHVEPNRPYPSPPPEKRTVEQKISFLQIAAISIVDDRLNVNRDTPQAPH